MQNILPCCPTILSQAADGLMSTSINSILTSILSTKGMNRNTTVKQKRQEKISSWGNMTHFNRIAKISWNQHKNLPE